MIIGCCVAIGLCVLFTTITISVGWLAALLTDSTDETDVIFMVSWFFTIICLTVVTYMLLVERGYV